MKSNFQTITTTILSITVITCSSQSNSIIAEGAELVQISNEYSFTEGPASDKNGNVFFTDQPNNKIIKWNAVDNSLHVFKDPAGRANGLYFDHNGYLLAAADDNNELWRINTIGEVDTLITHFEGKKLNGPNDLWVDNKGGVYITDPYYQRPYWERTAPEINKNRVYYISPDMKNISIVAHEFVQPNGIIGTPDGKTLYVADIGDQKTYSFSINEDGSLTNRELFTTLGSDGMTIDNRGNVYLTGEGVTVFNSAGEKIHHIPVDEEWTANVTFGGENQDLLFITAKGSVYSLKMNVNGVRYAN
ncbi:SMP-30/gluconolactonase/LRE family protein [Maribacter sp. ACAM166]|uniref:SMP-30/gluconolactonase/LRE family protein n=1 Tax=Maribacter sp. ACAM166 TaxID=2508996 RepID=UPI0010FF5BF8|nr:SMP-30/gluconolactonase/LRE family protein [Maribacter sp. ACAM166]TLP80370.1 SMP-30/gluconolactonase/LRE family protein [Maribacter sp. ACAM166]